MVLLLTFAPTEACNAADPPVFPLIVLLDIETILFALSANIPLPSQPPRTVLLLTVVFRIFNGLS